MPSLISILSSQSSSRFAHALSRETRVSTAENASVKVPANLGLSFGPAAPSTFHMPAPPPFQQHAPSFQQQLQHQLYQLPLMPAQQSIPRGSDSTHGISANPADRCGLHLIRGNVFDLRSQDLSTTAVSPAGMAGDVSISSSIRLADLISEYFEDCDEDGDALDGLTTLRTERSAQAQFHESRAGTATFLPATNPSRSNLGSQGEEANQWLSADYLDRQMQLTEQSQLRMVQSLADMDGPVESALYADVITAMTDARACHANVLRGSSMNAAVAGRLRAMGYDAAVCTTQWETSPTMPEGSYEYIDVLRFIVDLDFRVQFQIARPTREYACTLESTPLIFVGRQERLARLVEMVSGAMRGALRAQGMHIPPWRKGEYLHAKWMAAVSQRVVCEAKGMANDTEGEVEESKRVVGKGNVGEGMESKGMEKRGVGRGDKVTITAGGDLNGGEDFHAPPLSTVTSATSTADSAVPVKPAPAASPLSAGALPLASTTAPAGSFYASSAPGITGTARAAHALHQQQQQQQQEQLAHAGAAPALHHQRQQQQAPTPHAADTMGDAVLFQGRLVPTRRFAALHQCAQAGGR
ncbi:unnamed protein product [Closterium sp. Naga37s-1]|nr:unnamed protein product [Closterium sp. Naga37s-1]